jgi:putative ABC transport system permease protein
MIWLVDRVRSALARLVSTAHRARMVQRLDEEMQYHLDMQTDRNMRSGMPPDEARRAALVAFGGRQRFAEEARAEYRSRHLDELAQDARYTARSLRRAPTFAAAVVLTLAIGVGATTVIFSITDHVVLRPLPFAESDRLVIVREVVKEMSAAYPTVPANASHFLEWQRRCSACEEMAALRSTWLTLSGKGDPEQLGAARVSTNFFPLLGVRPQIGRLFTADDDRPGASDAVVITDALWKRAFGADPSVLGRSVTLNDATWTVVGVLPPTFRLPRGNELGDLVRLPRETDAFIPLALTPREMTTPGEFDYAVIARLAPGVSIAQARAQLDAIQTGIAERFSGRLTLRTELVPLQAQVVGSSGRALLLLLAAVGAVLLIVCVNLANLILARNAGRFREWAVRVAIGAGRGRLVRQLLTENVVLALLGGVLGIALARWGLAAMVKLAPSDLPRLGEVRLDTRVLAVGIFLSLAIGIAFAILPALRAGHVDPAEVLRAGGRTQTGGRRAARGRSLLIASQVGLSTVLLVATGLFISSFIHLLRVDKGFEPDRVLAVDVTLRRGGYGTWERRAQYFEQAVSRLHAMPGVISAALASALPLEGESEVNTLSLEHDPKPESERPRANLRFVSPTYFATLGVPVRRGRSFTESDRSGTPIVLSERAARVLWPGEDPIGKRMIAGDDDRLVSEVVGVVADVKTSSLEQEGSLVGYLPYWQRVPMHATILVRTAGDPGAMAAIARAELRSVDASVPVPRIRTMEQVVSAAVAQRRFQLVLLALFATTALIAASLGIYGVISHSLARRTNEIGIRMALGARPRDVHRLVLREGLTPVVLGLAAGCVASLALGRAFGSLLFEVRPSDPLMLLCVAALLSAVSTIACYVPARRATAAGAAALRLE